MELIPIRSFLHPYGITKLPIVTYYNNGFIISGGYNAYGFNNKVFYVDNKDVDNNKYISFLSDLPLSIKTNQYILVNNRIGIILYHRRYYLPLYTYSTEDDYWYKSEYLPTYIPDKLTLSTIPNIPITDSMFNCSLFDKPIPLSGCNIDDKTSSVIYGSNDIVVISIANDVKEISYKYRYKGYLSNGLGIWYNPISRNLLCYIPVSINGIIESIMVLLEYKE